MAIGSLPGSPGQPPNKVGARVGRPRGRNPAAGTTSISRCRRVLIGPSIGHARPPREPTRFDPGPARRGFGLLPRLSYSYVVLGPSPASCPSILPDFLGAGKSDEGRIRTWVRYGPSGIAKYLLTLCSPHFRSRVLRSTRSNMKQAQDSSAA